MFAQRSFEWSGNHEQHAHSLTRMNGASRLLESYLTLRIRGSPPTLTMSLAYKDADNVNASLLWTYSFIHTNTNSMSPPKSTAS